MSSKKSSAAARGLKNSKEEPDKDALSRMKELQDLDQEMEIARYATDNQGRRLRSVPQSQRLARTKKRKRLEKIDKEQQTITVLEEQLPDEGNDEEKNSSNNPAQLLLTTRRLRGSKAACLIADQDLTNPVEASFLGEIEDETPLREETESEDEDGGDGDGNGDEDEEENDSEFSENEVFEEEEEEDEDEDDGSCVKESDIEEDDDSEGRTNIGDDKVSPGNRTDNVASNAKESRRVTFSLDDASVEMNKSKDTINQKNSNQQENPKKTRGKYKKSERASGVWMARAMYRSKGFSSRKLAERHGLALGAHARGQQHLAVKRLSEVAEAAPIAPQVYSSLGLLYENLFLENNKAKLASKQTEAPGKSSQDDRPSDTQGNRFNEDEGGKGVTNSWMNRLKLGQKAYASYHVAAVLGKRDFTLWVRCGDAAMDLADLFSKQMVERYHISTEGEMQEMRELKKKWLVEALHDYDTADRLRPPGITVPCKLAHVHMAVGHLSETLTILTDLRFSSLKEQQQKERMQLEERVEGDDADILPCRQRSELDQSYRAWMLYADLMLRIGYECRQWERNHSKVDNYMFKRWLRKYHKTFDWRERRLQALCLALEAAVGSVAASNLARWLKDRGAAARSKRDMHSTSGYSDNAEGGTDDTQQKTPSTRPSTTQEADATGVNWNVQDTYDSERKQEREELEEQERQAKEKRKCAANSKTADTKDNETSSGNTGDKAVPSEKTETAKQNDNSKEAKDTTDEIRKAETDSQQEKDDESKTRRADKMEKGDEDSKEEAKEECESPGGVEGEENGNGFEDNDDNFAADENGYKETEGVSSNSDDKTNSEDARLPFGMRDGRFEEEKLLIKKRHQRELRDFDSQTTETLDTSNRAKEREDIVSRQKREWVDLIGSHIVLDDSDKKSGKSGNISTKGVDMDPLTMSASFATVYDIASQLLKHALSLRLFTCGRLVGEAVAQYTKDRYYRRQKRLQDQKTLVARSVRLEQNPLDIQEENEEESIVGFVNDEYIFLSDDEDLDEEDDRSQKMNAMKQGVLPPEICFLCGLCMVGEGGKDFLARKMLNAVDALPPEEAFDLNLDSKVASSNCNDVSLRHRAIMVDTHVYPDPEWVKLEAATRAPVKRYAALVFLADLLTTSTETISTTPSFVSQSSFDDQIKVKVASKAEIWADRIIPLFQKHVRFADGRRHLMTEEGTVVPSIVNQTFRLKLLLFMARMKICKGRRMYQSQKESHELSGNDQQENILPETSKDERVASNGLLQLVQSVIKDMEVARGELWHGIRTPDGRVNNNSLEMIHILKDAFELVIIDILDTKEMRNKADSLVFNDIEKEMESVLKFLFKIEIRELDAHAEGNNELNKTNEDYNSEEDNSTKPRAKDFADNGTNDMEEHSEDEAERNRKKVQNEAFTWKSLPLEHEWQKGYHRELTKKTLLICLANNVAVFSGYEDNEFALEVLYKKRTSGFFGVKLWERYAGYLPRASEKLLSQIWHFIKENKEQLFVTKSSPDEEECRDDSVLDFDEAMRSVKEAEWYQAKIDKFKSLSEGGKIARLGEQDGMDILLYFAMLQLYRVPYTNSSKEKELIVKNAMSVILPMSQFGIDQDLWTSEIGKGIQEERKMKPWRTYLKERTLFDGSSGGTNPSTYVYKRPKDRSGLASVTTSVVRSNTAGSASKRSAKSADVAVAPKVWKPQLLRTAHIPIGVLLSEWQKDKDAAPTSKDPLLPSKVAMKKVDYALRQLRSSMTVLSMQKASVRVAAALIEVAQDVRCYNPMLCLQQAAIFAGQGPKGGNNDEYFKQRLPSHETACTAHQALLILGRADCLRAISFTDEAIFLCSYAARVCSMHRDPAQLDFEWTPRWRVVGIQASMSSASIEATISSFLNESISTSVWDAHIDQELKCGRRDAEAFERAANEMNAPPPLDHSARHVPIGDKNSYTAQSDSVAERGEDLVGVTQTQPVHEDMTKTSSDNESNNVFHENESSNVDKMALPSFDEDENINDGDQHMSLQEEADGEILAV